MTIDKNRILLSLPRSDPRSFAGAAASAHGTGRHAFLFFGRTVCTAERVLTPQRGELAFGSPEKFATLDADRLLETWRKSCGRKSMSARKDTRKGNWTKICPFANDKPLPYFPERSSGWARFVDLGDVDLSGSGT